MIEKKNCILYLVRTSENDLQMLNKSLILLDHNLLAYTKAEDVILFHDPDFEPLKSKVYRPANGRIIFQKITFPVVPPGTPDIFPHPNPDQVAMGNLGFSIGYRHMCWFFSGGLYKEPIMDSFKYYLRLDTDSYILSPVGYDIFEAMKTGGYKYGYIEDAVQQDDPAVIVDLWPTADRICTILRDSLIVKPLSEIPEGRMYYTNFELGEIEWFQKSAYNSFFKYIELWCGIYRHRHGDAPIKYIGVNLFLEDKYKLPVRGFIYQHGAVYDLTK